MADTPLGPEHTAREDENDDSLFYELPRMVTHIDAPAIAALTRWFRENLPPGGRILDLMSSCVSHLPKNVEYEEVFGLGMNEAELAANPQLTDYVVHDLTEEPALPFEDGEFDACLITVSVQYLVHPIAVFREIARVLKPGSVCAVSFSNRMFPTKAIALWRALDDQDHARFVGWYFIQSEGFEEPAFTDLSPDPGRSDPLFMVSARRCSL